MNEELPKAATESAEANAEEKKPITDFAHGAFAVQWFKSGMSFTKENEELVQADRMMLNLRVNNGEQEATYNFLTELDYADQKKGFYANLPVTETKFLEKPNKSAYYTDLFLIKDKSGVDNSLLFTKKALKPLDGDQKYPTDPDALLQLVINQGAELCTF